MTDACTCVIPPSAFSLPLFPPSPFLLPYVCNHTIKGPFSRGVGNFALDLKASLLHNEMTATWGSARNLRADRIVPIGQRLLDAGAEWLIVWMAVLAILLAIAGYIISKVRGKAVQQEPVASELLTKFRDLHSQGGLSDAEYRTIKTTLASRLEVELKDNGEKG